LSTKTLGTNATTTLTAVSFSAAPATLSDADFATIRNAIKYDGVEGNAVYPGAFSRAGLLYVPRRGILKILPGDYIGIDSTGWPILVSANSIADGSTSWTHS